MTGPARPFWQSPWPWLVLVVALTALRVPAVAEPAGSDQSLYMYTAERMLEGGGPYVDAWDQKPPGVFVVYAIVRAIWPHASAVAVADLIAATLTGMFLMVIGRRALGDPAAFAIACAFLLFSHPSIKRLSGIYERGQCEVFIATAVTAALTCVWRERVGRWHLIVTGLALGMAVWLKYNAVMYVLPVGIAFLRPPGAHPSRGLKDLIAAVPWIAAGMAVVSAGFLVFLASHGALADWWLATISYNLAYSGETYTAGPAGALGYLARMPLERASADFLWFLGGVGLLLIVLGGFLRQGAAAAVAIGWLAAAVCSIALNGARDLPQYFIQAFPVLAFLFGTGMATLAGRPRAWAWAAAALIALGLWRVGTDAPGLAGLRWGGLPQLGRNVAADLAYLNGQVDHRSYLARFKGQQKYDALESDDLAALVRTTTRPGDRIYVFGFAPAVYLESGRTSASRFFWSRPVVIEFAADHPGYGSAGVLRDLEATAPAIVALQKQDWGPGEPNSEAFFRNTPRLGNWLLAHYVQERETSFFSVWRRREKS